MSGGIAQLHTVADFFPFEGFLVSTTGIRIIPMGDGMQMGSAVKSAAIYTLEGQRVNGTPRKGIYIKNGKKFIVK